MLLLSTKLFPEIDSLQQDCLRYSRKYLLIFMYSTHTVRLAVFCFRNAYPADKSKYCNVWYAKWKTFTYSMATRGGVEDTRLEGKAKAKDKKKIRGQGQGQPFRGQTLSRPRTGMLEAKAKDQEHSRKSSPKQKKRSSKSFSGNLQFIGLSRIFDWEGLNHKSHAMTSSKICLLALNQDFAKGEGLN